jgi:hypothetical protein
MRDLDNREARNIFKIKIDEIISDLPEVLRGEVILLKALNSFSSRFSSFTVLAEGEGFINPFFRLLDFSDRSAEVS